MSRLTEMEAFATVVEEGGFTDAARKMGVSKSAVSKHISALESRLGTRLLNRTTRRVNPTEIGLAYYDRASRILNDAGDADALVAQLHGSPSGLLQVNCDRDFGAHVLSPMLGAFLAQYPDIRVNLDLGDAQSEMIGDGFDMAIRRGPLSNSALRARRLCTYRLLLVASGDYLHRAGRPQSAADLLDHRLLGTSQRAGQNTWRLRDSDGTQKQVPVQGDVAVNDSPALLQAAINGMGVALLPDFLCADALADRRIECVLPDLPDQTQEVFALYPAGRYIQPKVRVFIDFLASELSPDRS
ncbi:LysR family transcriptional regulator [Ruegeria aquimaris]|uniref:LysR family transcriptional regulator n=1 Tax=Ruegeria aquimaris TaxID=2984333 RepID=A0ABT3AIG2_9RHOB|nr:LysR family transcriptional regulator [Ruegeria sp. XHP0148]MCV2888377.1 LysR family transcriptional regulator [Ruegeria sp. XHP0148]